MENTSEEGQIIVLHLNDPRLEERKCHLVPGTVDNSIHALASPISKDNPVAIKLVNIRLDLDPAMGDPGQDVGTDRRVSLTEAMIRLRETVISQLAYL